MHECGWLLSKHEEEGDGETVLFSVFMRCSHPRDGWMTGSAALQGSKFI